MKSNLKDALKKSAKPSRTPSVPAPERQPRAVHAGGDTRPHRTGKRMLGAHVDEGLYIAVRRVAAGLGVTMQDVVNEAFSDLLTKHKEA